MRQIRVHEERIIDILSGDTVSAAGLCTRAATKESIFSYKGTEYHHSGHVWKARVDVN